ncbi:MAG: hypothetical protein ABSA33_03780 [Candidatus Micrarchaeaceae archaeon]|jgi:hypothetical protein
MTQKLLVQDTVAPHVKAETLVAGAGISIVYGSGTITISGGGGGGGGYTWNNVTSASNPVTLLTGNGYVSSGAGVVNFTLPAAAAFGDTYRVVGNGNLWTLAQNAGQSIVYGDEITTAGVGGSLAASKISDCVEIVCTVANNLFEVVSSIGNIFVN